jgi:hypothetical protein
VRPKIRGRRSTVMLRVLPKHLDGESETLG